MRHRRVRVFVASHEPIVRPALACRQGSGGRRRHLRYALLCHAEQPACCIMLSNRLAVSCREGGGGSRRRHRRTTCKHRCPLSRRGGGGARGRRGGAARTDDDRRGGERRAGGAGRRQDPQAAAEEAAEEARGWPLCILFRRRYLSVRYSSHWWAVLLRFCSQSQGGCLRLRDGSLAGMPAPPQAVCSKRERERVRRARGHASFLGALVMRACVCVYVCVCACAFRPR